MTSPRVRAVTLTISALSLNILFAGCGGGSSGGGGGNPPPPPPPPPITNINVSVDVLANRHLPSPFIYGVNYPNDAAYITNTNTTLVRWGGNATSTYNWLLGKYNADNDYFFEDFAAGALNNAADSDSAQFIKDVKTAGSPVP